MNGWLWGRCRVRAAGALVTGVKTVAIVVVVQDVQTGLGLEPAADHELLVLLLEARRARRDALVRHDDGRLAWS